MSPRSPICHLCGQPTAEGVHQQAANVTERFKCVGCERHYVTVCRMNDGTTYFRCPKGHRAKLAAMK
jgi:hypothetical protein